MKSLKGLGGFGLSTSNKWQDVTYLHVQLNQDGSVTLFTLIQAGSKTVSHARITISEEDSCKLREILSGTISNPVSQVTIQGVNPEIVKKFMAENSGGGDILARGLAEAKDSYLKRDEPYHNPPGDFKISPNRETKKGPTE